MARMRFDLDPASTSAESVAEDRRRLRRAMWITGGFVLLLWLIQLIEWTFMLDPGALGVRPGAWSGLLGVLTAPLVHAGWEHLIANTSAILVLGVIAFRVYPRASRWALPVIWIGSGLMVWWLGRPPTHIGASGITHGLMFFLFALGLLRHERLAIVASMVVFFLYGSMVYSVLPQQPHVSWEYHLFGALFGLLAAVLLRQADPMPKPKLYSWDLEDEHENNGEYAYGDEDDYDDEFVIVDDEQPLSAKSRSNPPAPSPPDTRPLHRVD